MRRAASRSLFDLAPDGVYPASAVTLGAVGFYPTISPLPSFAKASEGKPPEATKKGGIISVALSITGDLAPMFPR